MPWASHAGLRGLQNPVFAGYMPYGDELHEGEHQALIDRPTFARAQALLQGAHGYFNLAHILPHAARHASLARRAHRRRDRPR